MAKLPMDLDDREEIDSKDWLLRGGIHVAGAIALLILAALNFEKKDVIQFVASSSPQVIIKLTLLIYYGCWHYGALIDLNLHKKILVRDPSKGAIDIKTIVVFVLFVATAYGFLWASSHEAIFSVAIFIFWSVLTYAGKIARDVALPVFVESGSWYAKHHKFYEVEKQVRVSRYFFGSQMKLRNKVGFGLAALIAVVTNVTPVREWIASLVHEQFISAADVTSINALIPSIAFASFVAITEGWQWMMRINVLNSVKVLNELKKKYHIEPYAESD